MRIPRIFVDQDLAPATQINLDSDASRHLCQVLRCRDGQELILFNGTGGEYSARIVEADKRACRVQLLNFDSTNRESPLKITLGLAMSKGDRFDWALQKSTELGVFCIQPLITERSELRLNTERMAKKIEHWKRLILSSCEQCQRNVPPALEAAMTLEEWLAQERRGPAYILQPGANPDNFVGTDNKITDVSLAIGPEGGFSQEEVELALSEGFVGMPLGPRVLRTETAPVAAISILQWHWGDLSN